MFLHKIDRLKSANNLMQGCSVVIKACDTGAIPLHTLRCLRVSAAYARLYISGSVRSNETSTILVPTNGLCISAYWGGASSRTAFVMQRRKGYSEGRVCWCSTPALRMRLA